jgi:hypothetical protein
MFAIRRFTVTSSFQAAFVRLLDRAPGPVFPRARQLYFHKYALESEPNGPFRTFLLEEEVQEAAGGALRVRALSFALVHWQAPQIERHHYSEYLQRHWGLEALDLALVSGDEWFRQGGAYARFRSPAVYERATPTTLVSGASGPVVPGVDPEPTQ